ncbi:aminoglycoside phosphotransferase family protein [Pedobacter sp. BS3]|uniref:phosphotransferase enzyme family protein n=1 Tax=Pedobacter sp. BS3 TaxID=2567937 RepID=UPI0011ECC0AB|nr:aminoglycoside phosphotransferase family protein [Pedobacter sp. BS3]TZF84056.1 aminoglycoside phosphotransferase family protein [Pedobacter sp. BS3]
MLGDILKAFDLQPDKFIIEEFGSGLINHTWKVRRNTNSYILQRVNTNVFKHPDQISENIEKIDNYLAQRYPRYLFVSPVRTRDGKFMVKNGNDYYRLAPFVEGSHTIDTVYTVKQAYQAASQFGKFTCLLSDFDANSLHYTLPDFHNLSLRIDQFKSAYHNARPERIKAAQAAIDEANKHQHIADLYEHIVSNNHIPKRVIHHDTKISNVLFDDEDNGLCVIDLDTVMPGYFISDLGDMMRTYLSPANEEEKDFSKISVRVEFFKAIIEGYYTQLAHSLTAEEKDLFVYAGKFIIYMQAIRFLTDYLNNDIYYGEAYPGHNLVRAQNQFVLLNKYIEAELQFQEIVLGFRDDVKIG